MKKSIFKKYLSVSTMIVVLSFLFLGIMLWTFVSQYWEQEKSELLTENAQAISNMIERQTVENESGQIYITDPTITQALITAFASNIKAEICVTNASGEKIFCSEGSKIANSEINIPQSAIKQAMEGSYIATTTLGGVYENVQFIVGLPISVQNNNDYEKKNIGVVFTSTDASHLYSFRFDIFQIFVIAAIVAFVLSLCAMGFLSYKMTHPLREMSLAAKSFGKGDFSQRINVKSKDEIGELAEAFNSMADSLSSSETIRRSFIANVSHELKTPMTTISGFIDGILDGTIPQEKQTYYLNIVSSETKRLSRLVRSMLDLSKIDSGKLKLNKKPFDLSQVIINTLISFEDKITAKNIQVEGLEDLKSIIVNGDVDMIHQVIYNLVDNAVKFVNKQGIIQILSETNSSYTTIKIRNSGLSIPDEEIKLIFDKFYKTDKSRSQDKNGVGLGLYIVKTIINLHGGSIQASSIPDKYTEFKFSLPIKFSKTQNKNFIKKEIDQNE